MGKTVLILISFAIAAFAVVMIYDARIIATKIYSSNETNETTRTLKIVGFIIFLISMLIIYFVR